MSSRRGGEWSRNSDDTSYLNSSRGGWSTTLTDVWPFQFLKRIPINLDIENTPYLDRLFKDTAETEGRNHGILHAFMYEPSHSDLCQPAADLAESFCSGDPIETLCTENGAVQWAELPRVAWLNERSAKDDQQASRTQRGPLTALDLYQELKKPRYRLHSPDLSTASAHISESVQVDPKTQRKPKEEGGAKTERSRQPDWECDPERRSILIKNLDRLTILALIRTVSLSQAPSLRHAIYAHLAFEASAGVKISTDERPSFQLSFHLPYFAWRGSSVPRSDLRRGKDGKALRRHHDSPFLSADHPQSCGYFYECQTSVLVTGFDDWRWTAYCLVDTYFEFGQEARKVHSNHQDTFGGDAGLTDPFTDCNLQDPRQYFLLVFRYRLDRAQCEWEQVVRKLKGQIDDYQQVYSLVASNQGSTRGHTNRSSLEGVLKLNSICVRARHCLVQTDEALVRFRQEEVAYFRGFPMYEIFCITERLAFLKRELDYVIEKCDSSSKDLEFRLVLESNVTSRQLCTYMTLASPILLAVATLQLETRSLFGSPNAMWLIGLILVFSILRILAFWLRNHRSRLQARIRNPFGSWFRLTNRNRRQMGQKKEAFKSTRGIYTADVEAEGFNRFQSSMSEPDGLAPSFEPVSGQPLSTLSHEGLGSSAKPCHKDSGSATTCLERTSPPICFEQSSHTSSLTNRIKLYLERVARQQLIWWPLRQPVRPVRRGMKRMAYKCACGTTVSFDVSESADFGISRLARMFTGRSTAQSGLPLSRQDVPTADQNPTIPTEHRSMPSQEDPPQGGLEIEFPNTRRQRCERFIYLCVGSNACARLFGLSARDYDDHSFIVEVQQSYAKAIGWWYSFWTMSSCGAIAVKKFHRLSDRKLVACGSKSELPTGSEYEYDGHPTDECIEFLESTASHRIQRHSGIWWPWYSRCRSSSTCSPFDHLELLSLIPKRKGALSAHANEGYGMQPVAQIAIWKLMVGSLFCLGGPVGFMIYWLQSHPGDLQSALAPFSAVVIVFAVYLDILFRSFR